MPTKNKKIYQEVLSIMWYNVVDNKQIKTRCDNFYNEDNLSK